MGRPWQFFKFETGTLLSDLAARMWSFGTVRCRCLWSMALWLLCGFARGGFEGRCFLWSWGTRFKEPPTRFVVAGWWRWRTIHSTINQCIPERMRLEVPLPCLLCRRALPRAGDDQTSHVLADTT